MVHPKIKEIALNKNQTDRFKYQMLGRLQSDCKYFLGNGNRDVNKLWAGNVVDHIDCMLELYNSFPEGEKPEWCTLEQIEQYKKEMLGT